MSLKLDRMEEYFSDVLNYENPWTMIFSTNTPCTIIPEAEALSEPLTVAEIIRALRLLRKGKVPGEDGNLMEMLQLGVSTVVEAMKKLADHIWKQESVPAAWRNISLCLSLRTGALRVSVITIVGSPC